MLKCSFCVVFRKRVFPSFNFNDLAKGLIRPKRARCVRTSNILIQPKIFSACLFCGERFDIGSAEWMVINLKKLLKKRQELRFQVFKSAHLGRALLQMKIAGKKCMGLLLTKAR